jgi:hypothetical protein
MPPRILAAPAVVAIALTLAACSGSSVRPVAAATPTPSFSSLFGGMTSAPASTPTSASPSAAAAAPTSPPPRFPAGYPKVVDVSSLPSQVRNWYKISGDTKAVALAPGVWTPLPPGATVEDAVASRSLDGFCASIKAYERQYLGGEDRPGACW